MINFFLNILWLIFGGLCMAIGWFVAALLMVLSIVGIPFVRSAINMGLFALWPFGRRVVERSDVTGHEDLGTGGFGVLANIVWLVFAGWWLALLHMIIAFGLALTVIGIPFAWQHMKFSGLALWPVGRAVVDRDDEEPSPLAVLDLKSKGFGE
jgi:uncharacterized membrane protein YccF (DUF307 family)